MASPAQKLLGLLNKVNNVATPAAIVALRLRISDNSELEQTAKDSLLNNLDEIVEDIQNIYDFTDEEVTSFYVNDPS